MASADWSNRGGTPFRYDKTIAANDAATHPDYPAIFAIWGRDRRDEATRFADLVGFLKKNAIISDYSQVALLLHSVRQDHSGAYLAALEARGIPAFCPRARAYFENDVIRDLVGCFAILFGWHGAGRGQVAGAVAELAAYVDGAIVELGRRFGAPRVDRRDREPPGGRGAGPAPRGLSLPAARAPTLRWSGQSGERSAQPR